MPEILGSIFAILLFFVVIPVLILRARDRSKLFGGLINRALGLCALVIVITVFSWLVYCIFTADIDLSFGLLLKLALTGGASVMFYWLMSRVGWEMFTDSGPGIEEYGIVEESPEYQEALIKARRNLPYFIEHVDRRFGEAYVMIPLEWEEGIVMNEWAYVIKHEHGVFTVSPMDWWISPNENYEEELDVSESDIVDWKIVHDDGRIKGAYSCIGAFNHFERKGRRLNRTMKKQKSMLVDVE